MPTPDSAVAPLWVYITSACFVFIYQTGDAVDGLIGKRTGMYSHPSTELFDHGIDSLVISFVSISMVCAFQTGYGWATMVLLWAFYSNFFFPSWQQKFTGSIHFAAGLNNPTEVQLFGMALLFIKGFFPWLFEITFSFRGATFPIYFVGIFLGGILSLRGIFGAIKEVVEKTKQKTEAFLALTPHISILVSIYLLFSGTPHPIIVSQPRLVLIMVSTNWNVMVLHLILCEMTKADLPITYLFLTQLPMLVFSYGVFSNTTLLTSYAFLLIATCYGAFHLVTTTKRILDEVCLKVCGMENYFSIQDWENKETKKNLLLRLEKFAN
jgi:hypothetical protein